MIFYTLLTYYPHIDRANIVLTAMIVYTMIYISLSEVTDDWWQTVAISSIAVLDFVLLYGGEYAPYVVNIIQDYANTIETNVTAAATGTIAFLKNNINVLISYFSFNTAQTILKNKHKNKHKHKKHRVSKKKHVRFAKENQYHVYSHSPAASGNIMGAGMYGGMMDSSIQMTPQQRLQQNLWKQYQEQMTRAASAPMIDNRHMIIKDDDHYLKSDDESGDSDVSSDLSNSEEGLDY